MMLQVYKFSRPAGSAKTRQGLEAWLLTKGRLVFSDMLLR